MLGGYRYTTVLVSKSASFASAEMAEVRCVLCRVLQKGLIGTRVRTPRPVPLSLPKQTPAPSLLSPAFPRGQITTGYNLEDDRCECVALQDFRAGEQVGVASLGRKPVCRVVCFLNTS